MFTSFNSFYKVLACIVLILIESLHCQDVLGCGGFVKSDVEINFSVVELKLYTKQGSLKYQTDCAPNSGYYLIPVYDKGDYVLKVEPPEGWAFEPESVDLHIDGTSDKCSAGEDINFQFMGFGVTGKVISLGQSEGPTGVTVALKQPSSKVIVQETQTGAGGKYTFSKVLPGDYVLEASHPTWKFHSAVQPVKVDKELGQTANLLVVHGYPVTGSVNSDSEGIPGVNFLLFTQNVDASAITDCHKTAVQGFSGFKGQPQVCHVVSKADGTFTFPSLPCGDYRLVPFYKGEHITFDVEPESVNFKIHHAAVQIKKPFDVAGFSVKGKVLSAPKGQGVPSAKVTVNGKEVTSAGPDGSYTLENMKTGVYKIEVEASQVYFEPVSVKVTPNTPELPDIVASSFDLCGKVVIDQLPPSLSQVTQYRKIQATLQGATGEVITFDSRADGSFCTQAKLGTYVVKPLLSEAEVRAGLVLVPHETSVTVKDQSVLGITFTQFRATVSGTVACLEPCKGMQVMLSSVNQPEEKKVVQTSLDKMSSSFVFKDVIPGKYRVSLIQDVWCWKEKTLDISVQEQDIGGLRFTQTGYILSVTLSHEITLDFAQENKPRNVGSFNVTRGINRFCLSEPGVYKLTPVSCHQFEKQEYAYDTSRPSLLTLTAVKHNMEGIITTKEETSDIMIKIRSSLEGNSPLIIGPLKSDKGPAPAPKEGEPTPPPPSGPFTYKMSYWAKSGEKLEITPMSQVVLFYPSYSQATISGEQCPGVVATFEGRRGVFITGKMNPALSGVKVTITPQNDPLSPVTVETDDKGEYKVGPLHGNTDYDVTAEKEGYELTPVKDQYGSFNAFKLAGIDAKVVDESNQPLGGALLSLTGSNQYRSNKLSGDDGIMSFVGLVPGEYFLRPMMKEYNFEPASQMINVKEGATIDVTIKALRVAFSCYGDVTSLNGEPEPGLLVEAVGLGDCGQYQEESKTEQDGAYRIRGLRPKCSYDVRLKRDAINKHIERVAPESRHVQVERSDLSNVNMIAFRRMNQMDLSGHVVTKDNFIPHLKVKLYRESDPDSPMHTVSLTLSNFFYLPSVQMDEQNYFVRLEASLSKLQYDFDTQEVTFSANTSHRHFVFNFEPKPQTMDSELTQGSFLALPLALLVIVIVYNREKVIPLAQQSVSFLQYINRTPTEVSPNGDSDDQPAMDITTKRKLKTRKT